MLNQQGFDLWANGYDKTVQLSEESNEYPFAGYKTVLNTIYNEVMQQPQARVLDIGFGTAVLTEKLYDAGHDISGFDFSQKMMDIATLKMPNAQLIQWDLANGIPQALQQKSYDAIISTYALHHFTDNEKATYIQQLTQLLTPHGKIYIGDVAFQTRELLESCREKSIDYWDDDEFYFVADEFSTQLQGICQVEFHQLSHCGGVFIVSI